MKKAEVIEELDKYLAITGVEEDTTKRKNPTSGLVMTNTTLYLSGGEQEIILGFDAKNENLVRVVLYSDDKARDIESSEDDSAVLIPMSNLIVEINKNALRAMKKHRLNKNSIRKAMSGAGVEKFEELKEALTQGSGAYVIVDGGAILDSNFEPITQNIDIKVYSSEPTVSGTQKAVRI